MVELLLENGSDPFQWISLDNGHRTSAVHKAMEDYPKNSAGFDILWRHIQHNGEGSKPIDSNGNTALHVAAKLGHEQLVKQLLHSCSCSPHKSPFNFNPHALNKNSETPLAVAASVGHVAVIKSILQLATPLTASNYNGMVVPPSYRVLCTVSPLYRILLNCLPFYHTFSQKIEDETEFDSHLELCILMINSGLSLKSEFWLAQDFETWLENCIPHIYNTPGFLEEFDEWILQPKMQKIKSFCSQQKNIILLGTKVLPN